MKKYAPQLMLILGLVGLSFGYGFISSTFELFPYKTIRNAFLAASALIELAQDEPDQQNIDFWDETGNTAPVYRSRASGAGSEFVFVLGNERTYSNSADATAYLAWIADRAGTIIHAWKYPGEIWRPLTGREAIGNNWRSYPVGAHLFDNGDILVSYHGVGTFPSAMGLAKFDKDSKLLWKRADYYHHWFSVGPDDKIYIPDLEMGTSPLRVPDHDKVITCEEVRFPHDSIAILDRNGNKIREIDTLSAIVNSDLAGLINSNKEERRVVETCDPTHLNDVQILSQSMADQYPRFKAGDLLVSFRSLNMIGVIDPKTERFKWHFVGPSHRQHSPRFAGNNRIIMFDNYGGPLSRGTSRVVSVDVGQDAYGTLFPADNAELPKAPFMSSTAGYIDVSESGDRILVSFTHQGLVWEIDSKSGEILWEFINTHQVDGKPARISVYTAKYVKAATFDVNHGHLSSAN